MRILLVEGDWIVAQSIKLIFRRAGVQVEWAPIGADGLDMARASYYDAAIMDINLIDMHWLRFQKNLRENGIFTPIIIVTDSDDKEDEIKSLNLGADGYLLKPFIGAELVSRIHAIVRRSRGHSQSVIRAGVVEVNMDSETVSARGVAMRLTRKEYQILEILLLRKGVVLTKEMCLRYLYGGIKKPMAKIIDVFICNLRKKLAAATGGEIYIETVWGSGYVLREARYLLSV